MSVTINVILDTRRIKSTTNKYPVKLRVTYEREPRLYTTVYELSGDDFDKLSGSAKISDQLKQIKESVTQIKAGAEKTIKDLVYFTFEDFEKEYIYNNGEFKQNKRIKTSKIEIKTDFDFSEYKKIFQIFNADCSDPSTISALYFSFIKQMLIESRIGNAKASHTAYRAFFRFKGNVRIERVTVDYLRDFLNWMVMNGTSKTTAGIYLRSMRTIFNNAISDGLISHKFYPFGRRKFQVPTSKRRKIALDIHELEMLYNYQPENESERKALDYWFFCYLANGMNPKDMLALKYKDINNGFIVFERTKTELSTRSNPQPISVVLVPELKAIIDRWGNPDKHPNNYVFAVYDDAMTALRKHDVSVQFIRVINDWMAKVFKKLGINKKSSTVVTRHTYSTMMKRAGASVEFIQEALGHTDKKTTENYLGSFEDEVKKQFAGKLLLFKKSSSTKTKNINL